MKARIIGMGSSLPKRILTNEELEKLVDTNDEWIVSRTGMRERRIAGDEEHASTMGADAAAKALQDAHIPPEKVGMILTATMTPDYLCPSTAALIQNQIGATQAAAVDCQAACTGFLYALSIAKAYVESGVYSYVLVVATEKMSSFIDYTDRSTCVLFGDGASAAVVAASGAGLAIGKVSLGSDGSLGGLLTIPAGGSRHPSTLSTVAAGDHYIKMAGREVFKHAVRRMTSAARDCLEQAQITEQELRWLVPHQANLRIIEAMAKQFDLTEDQVYRTVHKYGNTSGSSIAIATEELLHAEPLVCGDNLLLVAFGGGLTWGAVILTKVEER